MTQRTATRAAASKVHDRARQKIVRPDQLSVNEGATTVLTKGTFDLLHAGHLALISYCADRARLASDGARVVVVVETDCSVRTRKGANRPIQMEETRALQIAHLSEVTEVVLAGREELPEVIQAVRPSIYVKGMDTAGVELVEADGMCAKLEAEENPELAHLSDSCLIVVFSDDGSLSTSALIGQIQTASRGMRDD